MKKTLLFTLLTLFGMTQVVAQEYEYVPFVREGVKWMYSCDNILNYENGSFFPSGLYHFTLEIKGDTVIGGKHFKPVHLYSGTEINEENDTIPVYLREENKVVYAFIPENCRYWECPIGVGQLIEGPESEWIWTVGEEHILYDFNDPANYIDHCETTSNGWVFGFEYAGTDKVQIANHQRNRHCYTRYHGKEYNYIVEGIGYVGCNNCGMTLNYFYPLTTGYQVTYTLERVIDHDELIYKYGDFPFDYEYVPFVREGVKWVYFYSNPIGGLGYEDGFIPYGEHYYTFEMKGDTVIDGKSYKPVHLYSGSCINEVNDTVPVYLREEGKVVYGIIPDGRRYWECPIGIGTMVLDLRLISSVKTGEEFILYDFNDPAAFYGTTPDAYGYDHSDIVQIGNHLSKRLQFGYSDDYIIEGIGFVGNDVGTPLNYFYAVTTGLTQVVNHLSHVIEDGEIIYKTEWYNESDPSDYEYVPFVREGVKWVYYYENDFGPSVLDMPEGTQYYSFEMKGDVLIGDKHYKPVILTHYLDENGKEKEVEDFVPIYLREEDKVVYAIHADGIQHPQCPVGIYLYIGYPYNGLPLPAPSEEFVLYDFNDPKAFYDTFFEEKAPWSGSEGYDPYVEYLKTDTVTLGNHQSKCHYFNSIYYAENKIIEGVGYDGYVGMPLFYFDKRIAGFQVDYYLSHVIENGEIIYRGIHYNPDNRVGIDEVMTERGTAVTDSNYYNLMGQPVGTDVPTTPGIYIHQGKKIVIR